MNKDTVIGRVKVRAYIVETAAALGGAKHVEIFADGNAAIICPLGHIFLGKNHPDGSWRRFGGGDLLKRTPDNAYTLADDLGIEVVEK